MSIDALILWMFVAAWVVVVGLLAFVQVPRIVGEGLRIVKHVMRLIDSSPLALEVAQAQAAAARIQRAIAYAPALRSRAINALTLIREVRLLPPEIARLRHRVQFEVAAFRASR